VGGGVCLETVDVGVQGRAEYVLPVPMGSPLNYYGVGDFRIPTAGTAPGNTGARAATATDAPNGWGSASGAFADGGSTHANDDDGEQQGYRNFGFTIPTGSTIDGIEVRVKASSTDSSGCQIGVELSWNNGAAGSYTARKTQSLTNAFPASPYSLLGGPTDDWGRTSWTAAELADGLFRLVVTDIDPTGAGCTDTATTNLDYLNVTVYYTQPTVTTQTRSITTQGFSGGTVLPSQGFWGAIEGQGSNRQTGDAYATGYNPHPTANSQYDPLGYDYTIELPQGGSVKVFDPTFCATSSGPGGGHYGTGDHWLGTANPVSTYFVLWDTNGSPMRTQHTPTGHSSGILFENEYQANLITGSDFSDGTEPTNPTNCGEGVITNPNVGGYYHNRWWTLASSLPAGVYRLQVTTTKPTSPTANSDESFENMWSILAEGNGNPNIYGSGRMVSYANIESGGQSFHLAQIDRDSGAGKTVEIRLFDPGDVGAKAWLEILSPDGNSYDPVTFDYAADNGRSGTGATCIQTFAGSGPSAPAGCPNLTSGGHLYQNSWITITVPLAATYGSTGLQPPSETEGGWWKIRYTVNSANDTTTWEVNLRGNPVHLVIP
jgi:hypothetical protein